MDGRKGDRYCMTEKRERKGEKRKKRKREEKRKKREEGVGREK